MPMPDFPGRRKDEIQTTTEDFSEVAVPQQFKLDSKVIIISDKEEVPETLENSLMIGLDVGKEESAKKVDEAIDRLFEEFPEITLDEKKEVLKIMSGGKKEGKLFNLTNFLNALIIKQSGDPNAEAWIKKQFAGGMRESKEKITETSLEFLKKRLLGIPRKYDSKPNFNGNLLQILKIFMGQKINTLMEGLNQISPKEALILLLQDKSIDRKFSSSTLMVDILNNMAKDNNPPKNKPLTQEEAKSIRERSGA